MTQIAYADPDAAAPGLGVVGGEPEDAELRRSRARLATALPLALTGGVQLFFFLSYWLPETSAFPAHRWWLTELAPLGWPTLTSGGQPEVEAQRGAWGLAGAVLLVASVAVYAMPRSRHWLGRPATVVPALVGVLTCLVTVVALLVAGAVPRSAVSILVMIVWMIAAGYAAFYGLRGEAPARPERTVRRGLPVLVGYALLAPLPTAVGRSLFAPELRDVAADLQHNTVALRLAALVTPATGLLYLTGVLVGVTVWAAVHWWPPRRDLAFVTWSLVLAASMVVTSALGWPTGTVAARRVTTLLYASPASATHFTCGAWQLAPAPDAGVRPRVTLVITGLTCRDVTSYTGYRQTSTGRMAASLSPVTAHTVDGAALGGRVVAAQYDDVLVVAASDRLDARADRLFGLRVGDTSQQWAYVCGRGHPLDVSFGSSADRHPVLTVRCDGRLRNLDPDTGRTA